MNQQTVVQLVAVLVLLVVAAIAEQRECRQLICPEKQTLCIFNIWLNVPPANSPGDRRTCPPFVA